MRLKTFREWTYILQNSCVETCPFGAPSFFLFFGGGGGGGGGVVRVNNRVGTNDKVEAVFDFSLHIIYGPDDERDSPTFSFLDPFSFLAQRIPHFFFSQSFFFPRSKKVVNLASFQGRPRSFSEPTKPTSWLDPMISS
jgi:hypothetical protein